MRDPNSRSLSARLLRNIPVGLIVLRFVLGPLVFAAAYAEVGSAWIVGLLVLAMLSDIFDGVIARRLGVATEKLRVADSRIDAWFFACVGCAACFVVPQVLRAYWIPLTIEVTLQLASYIFDLAKYGRIASLHAYTAKAWGFTLYLAAVGLLAFHSGALIWLAMAFGMASAVDATIIKLTLPGWRHDVLSTFHARKMVKQELTSRLERSNQV